MYYAIFGFDEVTGLPKKAEYQYCYRSLETAKEAFENWMECAPGTDYWIEEISEQDGEIVD